MSSCCLRKARPSAAAFLRSDSGIISDSCWCFDQPIFWEVIQIDSLNFVPGNRGYSHIEVDHQFGQPLPADEDDLFSNSLDESLGVRAELRSRDQDTLLRAMTL